MLSRRRLWRQWPRFYQQANAALGMTPRGLPGGRQGHAHPFRRRSLFAWRDPGGAKRGGHLRHSAGDDAQRFGAGSEDKFPNAELIGGDARCMKR